MSNKKYPRIVGRRRLPDEKRDGGKNYGKPCVICGTGTCGEKWIQFSFMRGDDEIARVCSKHWKHEESTIVKAYLNATGESDDANT